MSNEATTSIKPRVGSYWVATCDGKPAVIRVTSAKFCDVLGSHTGDYLDDVELIEEVKVDEIHARFQAEKLKTAAFMEAIDKPYDPEGAGEPMTNHRFTTRRETCRGQLGALWMKPVLMYGGKTGARKVATWIPAKCQCADNRTYCVPIGVEV